MDTELRALLDRLAELNSEELADLETRLQAHFDDIRSGEVEIEGGDQVAALTEVADGVDLVRARQTELEAAEIERQAAIDELDRRVRGESQDPTEGEGDNTDGESTEGEGTGDGDTEGDSGESETTTTTTTETETETAPAEAREPVAASGGRAPLGAVNRRRPANGAPVGGQRTASRIIGERGDFANLGEVAEAMIDRKRRFMGTRSANPFVENVVVASIEAEYGEDRQLGDNARENQRRIDSIASDDAIVAAGGLCAPTEPYYGLTNVANADRPVRAALAGFQADRGGIRYMTPPQLPEFSGAVGIWTVDNDADPGTDGPATKPCLVVPCGDENEAVIRAVTRCLQFGNFGARAWPEAVENATSLTLAAFSRTAETELLDDIKAGSKAVTAGQTLGAARDLLYTVGAAASRYRARHRMADGVRLRMLAPRHVRDMIRDDLARGLDSATDRLAVADAVIDRYLADRGVTLSTHLDSTSDDTGITSAQNVGALLDYPDTVQFALFHEGAWLYLDGGQLDLGLVRDSTLNSTNDYQIFAETFEGAAFVGIESLWVTQTICANGAASGTIDPADFCAGSYIPA